MFLKHLSYHKAQLTECHQKGDGNSTLLTPESDLRCWPLRAVSLAPIFPAVPLKSVEPPESTMLEKSVRRRSMSDLWMAKASTSWSPSLSSPTRSGWNSSSGARKRAGPTCEDGPGTGSPEKPVLSPRSALATTLESGHLHQACCHLEGCTAPSQSPEPHPFVG